MFRDAVLTALRRTAVGAWERRLIALSYPTSAAVNAVQKAAAAVVRAEAAIEQRILPADDGNVAAMRRHPRLGRSYFTAHDRFYRAIQDVDDWIELTVCDLVDWARQQTLTAAQRAVIERWLVELMPGLYGTVETRDRLRDVARVRGKLGGHHGKGRPKRQHNELFWRTAEHLEKNGHEPTRANVRKAIKLGWQQLCEKGDPLSDIVSVNVRGSVIDIEYTKHWARRLRRSKCFVEVDDEALAKALNRRPKDR